jgi:hypothetical protein
VSRVVLLELPRFLELVVFWGSADFGFFAALSVGACFLFLPPTLRFTGCFGFVFSAFSPLAFAASSFPLFFFSSFSMRIMQLITCLFMLERMICFEQQGHS